MKYTLFLLLISFSSCIGSMYPISENEKEYVIRNEIFGRWKEKDDNTEYIIERTKNAYFHITVIDKDGKSGSGQLPVSMYDTSRFMAFMIKKNNLYFLDCFADKDFIKKSGFGKNASNTLLPIHMIFKILSIKDNELRFSTLDPDLFKNQAAKKLVSIKHEILTGDEILLTEPPGKLQQKLSNANAPFGEVSIFQRIK